MAWYVLPDNILHWDDPKKVGKTACSGDLIGGKPLPGGLPTREMRFCRECRKRSSMLDRPHVLDL